MEKQIERIAELATQLIMEEKATIETAFLMALKLDSERCLNVIDDMNDMKSGYKNELNKTQKAYGILLNDVYSKLS